MNTKHISFDEILAAGFHCDSSTHSWHKHLGNRVDVVLSDESGGEPRSGSDLIVHLKHKDEQGRATTLMEQFYAFGDLQDVVGRFARVRSSTAAVVMKDDAHLDYVAWFNDGSVACGVATKGLDIAIPTEVNKPTEGDVVAALREDIMNSKPVYKPIEYKPDSAETRAALCKTMGVKFTPTVQEMRDALTKLRECAKAYEASDDDCDVQDAWQCAEVAGLELCLKGGWDWEAADLPSGEALSDYCLKATPLECAEATLLAFEAAMTKRNSIFVEVLVLTPEEVQANLDKYQHIADVNEDMTDIKCFHTCKACGWSIVEWNDGHFWTLCCNEDENFESLASAIEWLRVRF